MIRQFTKTAALVLALGGSAHADRPLMQQAPTPPPDSAGQPAVSPDGRWIAFWAIRNGQVDLFLIAPDGTGERRLTNTAEHEGPPKWSRDGRQVIFGTGGRDATTVNAVTISDGTTRVLARVQGRDAVLAPSGDAVLRSAGPFIAARLIVSALDGSGERAITDGVGSAFNAVWSPDGTQVAYTRLAPDRHIAVWIVNADGTGARALTHLSAGEGRAQVPAFSPDGKRIAVQVGGPGGREGNAHIAVIDVATSTLTALAPHDRAWLDETPSWFPDGRLAFQSDRTGRMEIWIMNGDGTGARQVTRTPGTDAPARVRHDDDRR